MLVAKNQLANAEVGSIPGSGRSPGRGYDNLLQHSCLENPMDRGSWQVTVHGIAKSRTRLKRLSRQSGASIVLRIHLEDMRVLSLGQEDPLGKEMATHSRILAWRIPWKEESDGLQFTGSQRVRRD